MYNYINIQLICLQYNYLDSVTCIIIMNFTSTCILHNIHVCVVKTYWVSILYDNQL